MIKKVKSDPALCAAPSLSRGNDRLHNDSRGRSGSAPCLARYGRSGSASRDPAIRSAIECKAKLVIFLALSVSNQTAFGNALTALDAALEVNNISRDSSGAPELLRRLFTRVALEVLVYHVVGGGGDAFHYAMCLLLADRAKRLLE